jgi:hypothetical protein
MSDGWSTKGSECKHFTLGDISFKRFARSRHEYLLENTVLKTFDEQGKITMALRIVPPRLMFGKSCIDIFAASLENPYMRLHVSKSVIVNMYIQDGLHAKGFARKQWSRHELHYSHDVDNIDKFMSWATEWTIGMRCVSHSASSALRWGLATFVSESTVDDAHMSIKSCVNSTCGLHNHVDMFLMRHVIYENALDTVSQRNIFWVSMGVSGVMIDLIMQVDPRWDPKRRVLKVSVALQNLQGRNTIKSMIMFFLCWNDWSDTRWAGCGPAARKFVGSLCVGLSDLVQLVKQHGKNNDKSFIGAYDRCTGEVRKYLCIACFGSYPIEAFSLRMLEDDRFFRNGSRYWQEVQEELTYVSELPMFIFDELAAVIDLPHYYGHRLRSDTLQTIHTSIAYLEREAYVLLRTYPGSLTQGDIETNVSNLAKTTDVIHDGVVNKIQICSRLMPLRCKQALLLLRDAPCSTALAEKGHKSGAFLSRDHSTLGPTQLRARAYLNQTLVMLRLSPKEKTAIALQEKIDERRQAAKRIRYSARNVFCSKMLGGIVEHSSWSLNHSDAQRLAKRCFATHASSFNALSIQQQTILAEEAENVKKLRLNACFDDIRHVHAQLVLLERREAEQGGEKGHVDV